MKRIETNLENRIKQIDPRVTKVEIYFSNLDYCQIYVTIKDKHYDDALMDKLIEEEILFMDTYPDIHFSFRYLPDLSD